jgi:hypothetical protein
MTPVPAQILETSVPQMQDKGCIKVRADADITVFDQATVFGIRGKIAFSGRHKNPGHPSHTHAPSARKSSR